MIKRCPKCNEPLYAQHIDKIDKAYCHHCGHEGKFSDGLPIINADRIRNMAEEELEKFLSDCSDCASCYLDEPSNCGTKETCVKAFLKWLKQPVGD